MILAAIELVSYIISGILYDKLLGGRRKHVFTISYVVVLIGILTLMSIDAVNNPLSDLAATYIAKAGVSSAYQSIYLINSIFPVIFASTTFGLCNTFGGLSSILSLETALLPEKT